MSAGIELPTLTILSRWEELFQHPGRSKLESILPDYLRPRRWFGSKTRTIRSASLHTIIPVTTPLPEGWVHQSPERQFYYNLIQVRYVEGSPELYALPLTFISAEQGERLLENNPHVIVARLEGSARGFLCDALIEEPFAEVFLKAMAGIRVLGRGVGNRPMSSMAAYEAIRDQKLGAPRIIGSEQSNTSIIFGDKLILKCYRRLEEGVNLDLEIGSFLTEAGFPHIAPVVGALEFQGDSPSEPITLAILHAFVPNQGDAWHVTLKELGRFYQALLADGRPRPEVPSGRLLDLAESGQPPAAARDYPAAESATLLGQRTAELHLALAKGHQPAFVPEPFSSHDQQSLYQSLCELHGRVFELLRVRLADLPDVVREEARQVLDRSAVIPGRLERIREQPLTGQRIRCHGDYHLGQVLFTGQDFVILDFEGEPARPLVERRRKTSPLRDVAGMIRSFHYAAYCALPHAAAALEPWAQYWYSWTSVEFLRAYLATAGGGTFLPAARQELQLLLDTFLLEKAMYELAYELNHRPDWVRIPLRGIGQLLETNIG